MSSGGWNKGMPLSAAHKEAVTRSMQRYAVNEQKLATALRRLIRSPQNVDYYRRILDGEGHYEAACRAAGMEP